MKNKTVKRICIVIVIMILAIVTINLFPEIEAELHRITGWN